MVYVSCADLRKGDQESPPSLENSNLINSHCLISETDLGPDWKTKSSLAPPPPCNNYLDPRTKLATGHFEFPLVRLRLSELLDELNVVKNSYLYRRK